MEDEVVDNYGSYNEGTMYRSSWGSNMWRKEEEFVNDATIVTKDKIIEQHPITRRFSNEISMEEEGMKILICILEKREPW